MSKHEINITVHLNTEVEGEKNKRKETPHPLANESSSMMGGFGNPAPVRTLEVKPQEIEAPIESNSNNINVVGGEKSFVNVPNDLSKIDYTDNFKGKELPRSVNIQDVNLSSNDGNEIVKYIKKYFPNYNYPSPLGFTYTYYGDSILVNCLVWGKDLLEYKDIVTDYDLFVVLVEDMIADLQKNGSNKPTPAPKKVEDNSMGSLSGSSAVGGFSSAPIQDEVKTVTPKQEVVEPKQEVVGGTSMMGGFSNNTPKASTSSSSSYSSSSSFSSSSSSISSSSSTTTTTSKPTTSSYSSIETGFMKGAKVMSVIAFFTIILAIFMGYIAKAEVKDYVVYEHAIDSSPIYKNVNVGVTAGFFYAIGFLAALILPLVGMFNQIQKKYIFGFLGVGGSFISLISYIIATASLNFNNGFKSYYPESNFTKVTISASTDGFAGFTIFLYVAITVVLVIYSILLLKDYKENN